MCVQKSGFSNLCAQNDKFNKYIYRVIQISERVKTMQQEIDNDHFKMSPHSPQLWPCMIITLNGCLVFPGKLSSYAFMFYIFNLLYYLLLMGTK